MKIVDWKEQAKSAIKNGFNLVPLVYAQKFPSQKNWTSLNLKEEDLGSLERSGFGILCGVGEHPVYAFDCDVKDKNIADQFSSNFEVLHGKPLIRTGKKPKILIPFRMEKAGIPKKKTPVSPEGHIDILGYGQQFVAYNIHPYTREEYVWTIAPHDVLVEDLPLLSESDVDYWFDFFKSLLTLPEKKKSEPKVWKHQGNRQYTNREIQAFLSCFGEEFYNASHDEWIPVVMAVHHETRGSNKGKEIARAWSKQGVTYDEDNFNYKWDTFDFEEIGDEKKKRSTFTSLFYKYGHLIPAGLLEDRFTDAYNKAMFSVFNARRFLYAYDLREWYKKNGYIWRITGDKIAGYIMEFLTSMKKEAWDLCEECEEEDLVKKNPRSLYFKAYARRKANEQTSSLCPYHPDCHARLVFPPALKIVPELAGLTYSYFSAKSESSKLHQLQGVDKDTADTLGNWEGGLSAASIIIPPYVGANKPFLVRLASGAAINTAMGMAGRGAASKVLSDNGYHEMAEHYKILDWESMRLDAMIGTFFALVHTNEAKAFTKKYAGKMGEIISDLKDGISERSLYRHAHKDSSLGLHTTHEAHKAHMDTLASTIKSMALGEPPRFNNKNLNTIAENIIADPHFKSHLGEVEPQPVQKQGSESVFPREQLDPIWHLDEHAHQRLLELEKASPELAKEVYNHGGEEAKMAHTIKEKKLYQVAVDCFLRTGGII